MIANDGNIMEHAVPFDGTMDLYGTGNLLDSKGQLPTQSIAERYDIIVDFSKYGIQPEDKLYFVNMLEHKTGQVVSKKIPLADILSGAYKAELKLVNGLPGQWDKGDPAVGKFLEFRVRAYSGTDLSMNPADYVPGNPGNKTMIPLLVHHDNCADLAMLENMRHRTFAFGRGGTAESPWIITTDDGLLGPVQPGFNMDPRRISATPQLTTGPTQASPSGYPEVAREVWTIEGGQGWDHPIHVHFEEGVYLSRGGPPETPATCLANRANGNPPPNAPPEWEKWARKDMYRIGPDTDSASPIHMTIRFRDFTGTYVEHCHNTTHEDHAMLLRWDLEHPGQYQSMATPLPSWDGVMYADSAALPTVRTVELFMNPVDNVIPGTSTVCTPTVIGIPGAGTLEYKYEDRRYGGAWQVVQPWSSTANPFIWKTPTFYRGKYDMRVSVRQVGTTAILGMGTMPYTMADPASELASTPATSTTVGSPVTFTGWTAAGTGPYEYEFQARFPAVRGAPCGAMRTDNTWTWNTTGAPATGYEFQVNARPVGGGSVTPSSTVPFTLTSSARDRRGAVPRIPRSQHDGRAASVTFTGSATGTGPYEYEFQARFPRRHVGHRARLRDGQLVDVEHHGLPRRRVRVPGQRADGGQRHGRDVAHAPVHADVSRRDRRGAFRESPGQHDGRHLRDVHGVGAGTGPFEYEFQARFPGGTWGTVRGYATNDTWTWNSTGAPATGYEFQVNVRTVGSATVVTSPMLPYTLTTAGATSVDLSRIPRAARRSATA